MKAHSNFIFSSFLFLFLIAFGGIHSQTIDYKKAKEIFSDIKKVLTKDSDKLWGIELYGPVMFADPSTREIVTNEPDQNGNLKEVEGVFFGKLEDKVNIANTAIDWSGKKWTMVRLPLPEDNDARRDLIIHEMFHRVQEKLKLNSPGATNNHLDTKDARILVRLEWEALRSALKNEKSAFKNDIKNALIFRELRRKKFPEAVKSENALEIHEGLPSYTGAKLGIADPKRRIEYVYKLIDKTEVLPSFVRSFAYYSGPLYGLILDRSNTNWRKNLKAEDDLGALTSAAFKIQLPKKLEKDYENILSKYNGQRIVNFETERETKRQERDALYKSKFVDGPLLILNLMQMNIQLNPNNVSALEGYGTVYPTARIVDKWGIIETEKGLLIDNNWQKAIVALPFKENGNVYEGDGWKLTLNEGWKIEKEKDSNNYVIIEKK